MVLLVSYDLNNHERPTAYKAVAEVIEHKAISFKRPLYSQWFVETGESPQAWSDALTRVMDDDDNLFVCRVQRPYQGFLPKSVWEWLSPRT